MGTSKTKQVAIVGGGWAGLAAAVELSRQNIQVSLFESSPQLGGRARSIQWNGMTLDNGQHLMIGAYQQMLALLTTLDADIKQLFKQLPHHMLMRDANTGSTRFDLQLPSLPAPLHLLFGVLKTPYLTFTEKFQLLVRFDRLLKKTLKDDLTVSDWLAGAGLPEAYIKYLLEPVCLAALTTHPQQASAKAFQAVLQQTFNGPAHFTDLLIPSTDLGQVFPALAQKFIEQKHGEIHIRSKVQGLRLDSRQPGPALASIMVNNQPQQFDHIILATPPSVTCKLLSELEETRAISEQINKLQYEPISTLYLSFEQAVNLPAPMTGLINGLAEWVFEGATSGHHHLLAVVISAQGEHLQMPQPQLVGKILGELKQLIPDLPTLLDSKLIIEKRATFQCHPNVDQFRPGIKTELSNLNLCGDYVYIEENNQPGLPSTLEGALRSGVKCAQMLIQQLNNNPTQR